MQRAEVFHREELAKRGESAHVRGWRIRSLHHGATENRQEHVHPRGPLIPVLGDDYGSQVVYADLWEDRAAYRGDVIVAAIRTELLKFSGFILKAAQGVGLDRIKVGGLEMTLDHIGIGIGKGEGAVRVE